MASDQKSGFSWLLLLTFITGAATFAVVALLVNIFERKQEARAPFTKVVEVSEVSSDPEPWGLNFPQQYEDYLKTVNDPYTDFGGNHALPPSKLEESPWLKRLFAGYAFSIDYREARGHAHMLADQEVTKRVTDVQQSGACMHCHASIIPTYRRIGLETMGEEATVDKLAEDFRMDAVLAGFKEVSQKKYEEVHAEVEKTPDGMDPESGDPHIGGAHPVSCVDCHDPKTMQIRVTRPGFVLGIDKLAKSDEPVPHLPSVEQWRKDGRQGDYDPNTMATRQEMRSFVCGQCHVEYYCANKMTLTFPWSNGLKMEQLEAEWDTTTFPDGDDFYDYVHKETGTKVYKAQHPEFELWSQGIHARSGVSCSDCHMPYEKVGATKVSSHWVRSPMMNINKACQTCHKIPEEEIKARVDTIQDRTKALIERAAAAMTEMLDAIIAVQKAGASEEQLAPIRKLQRKAMWRLDYIASENSKGFHARQEAARILGESIDYSRQAIAACWKLELDEGSAEETAAVEE
ncbi:ammonia-forming cytochrome c nitrite reductase subunit c552 [Roseiconus lacunae]|uniref:nitrite reductase (cytochrome; ammonia-forming) n=1 Tax=Roseiconus lacunae TaxID=2605694 RepID=A0ABT7PBJ5_9BACT|nr:ammonia-forming cytochrome c nitrite reductase subunit c552 [Roseiconus lacunae]MDM4013821.1 ammonia-forming cytochrome c nitrite reductase subunit c552 [Roseiconus lacunae]WRQ53128.1 ammonia-forming cytochrome c nitrite reductase subunit c552 [Stieleria sp. HD01]